MITLAVARVLPDGAGSALAGVAAHGALPSSADTSRRRLDHLPTTIAVIKHTVGEATPAELHAEAHTDMVDSAGKYHRNGHDRTLFILG